MPEDRVRRLNELGFVWDGAAAFAKRKEVCVCDLLVRQKTHQPALLRARTLGLKVQGLGCSLHVRLGLGVRV